MDMCVEYVGERESELCEKSQISLDLISYWIDDDSFSGYTVSEDIGVGPGFFIEELAEDDVIHKTIANNDILIIIITHVFSDRSYNDRIYYYLYLPDNKVWWENFSGVHFYQVAPPWIFCSNHLVGGEWLR